MSHGNLHFSPNTKEHLSEQLKLNKLLTLFSGVQGYSHLAIKGNSGEVLYDVVVLLA